MIWSHSRMPKKKKNEARRLRGLAKLEEKKQRAQKKKNEGRRLRGLAKLEEKKLLAQKNAQEERCKKEKEAQQEAKEKFLRSSEDTSTPPPSQIRLLLVDGTEILCPPNCVKLIDALVYAEEQTGQSLFPVDPRWNPCKQCTVNQKAEYMTIQTDEENSLYVFCAADNTVQFFEYGSSLPDSITRFVNQDTNARLRVGQQINIDRQDDEPSSYIVVQILSDHEDAVLVLAYPTDGATHQCFHAQQKGGKSVFALSDTRRFTQSADGTVTTVLIDGCKIETVKEKVEKDAPFILWRNITRYTQYVTYEDTSTTTVLWPDEGDQTAHLNHQSCTGVRTRHYGSMQHTDELSQNNTTTMAQDGGTLVIAKGTIPNGHLVYVQEKEGTIRRVACYKGKRSDGGDEYRVSPHLYGLANGNMKMLEQGQVLDNDHTFTMKDGIRVTTRGGHDTDYTDPMPMLHLESVAGDNSIDVVPCSFSWTDFYEKNRRRTRAV